MIKFSNITSFQGPQKIDAMKSPKKNIKIYRNRFPVDFFNEKEHRKLYSSISIVRSKKEKEQNAKLNVQKQVLQVNNKRQNKTSRQTRNKEDEDLIMGIISTTRKMKRVFRKHSIEFQKQNREKKDGYSIELPALLLKKGLTSVI